MTRDQPSNSFDELRYSTQIVYQEPTNKRLSPPSGVDPDQWATHLAHVSAMEPANLLNHVRRIYLHLAHKQSNALYGAMLDLHLVLGEKGGRLRQQLLKMAGKLLSREEYDLFHTCGSPGLQSHQPLPPSPHSVLGNFFSGKMPLVKMQNVEAEAENREIDPLELAREELNYGDITVAQQILEEALLRFPERLGLHYSLLEIYKHTRSLDDLLSMKDQLGDDIGIAQAAWNQARKAIEHSSR
jgi:hypothetical protein